MNESQRERLVIGLGIAMSVILAAGAVAVLANRRRMMPRRWRARHYHRPVLYGPAYEASSEGLDDDETEAGAANDDAANDDRDETASTPGTSDPDRNTG